MDLITALLPQELTPGWAVSLIILSFFTSAFNATFGIGGGLVILTVLLQILPAAIVLPLHGLIQLGSNTGRAWSMRSSVCVAILRWFILGAALGVGLAGMIFVTLPTSLLTITLGLFILWSIWGHRFNFLSIPDKGFVAVGAVASFFSMFLGATGAMVAAFWNQQRLGGKEGQVATHGAVMAVTHAFKCVAFGFLGFAFSEWLFFLLAMVSVGYAGTLTGKRILSRLKEETFKAGFKIVMTLLALRLIWQGIQG